MRYGRATQLLNRLGEGESSVQAELLELLYGELHDLARRHMVNQRRDHTLQPTALVNEAWLRLSNQESPSFEGRKQFFSLASKTMRCVLVDHARTQNAQKRGGRAVSITFEGVEDVVDRDQIDLLALDDALERLKSMDAELAEIVELRFFGGFGHEEIALAVGSSKRSVQRHWQLARAWLQRELSG